MYISRTSEVCGGNWCGMLLALPDIAHDKFGGNLLRFDQLVVALYSLSSFAYSSTFSATKYFNGQWAGVGSMLSFSDVFYPVSGCWRVWWVAQGTFWAMSHCQDTSIELRRASLPVVSFTFTGIFYLFPFPSRLSLLRYLTLLPKEYTVWDSTYSVTHIKVYYINHSPHIHIASPYILKGSQFALGINLSWLPPCPLHIWQ